jgi:hypothetical protein
MSEEIKDENPVDPIELSIFKEHVENNLLNILDSLPKTEKRLVYEESCLPKLLFFTTREKLISKKVQKDFIKLKSGILMAGCSVIVYIIPPKKECLEIINNHIEGNNKKTDENNEEIKNKIEYHVIFFPKINLECENYLKDSYNYACFNKHNLNMDIYPLDYEILSLELNQSFHELYAINNYNSIFLLNRAIIKYETVFGKIKYKYYLGSLGKKLKDLLEEEEKNANLDEEQSTLACVLLDRSIDMITPLITNNIYEALLDDNFNINLNEINVPIKMLDSNSKNNTIQTIDLSKKDKFYTNIKDYGFNQIRSYLPSRLQEQNKILEESKKRTTDLVKIQEDLKNLTKVKEERTSLTNHINLADYIGKKERYPLSRFYYTYEQGLLYGTVPEKFFDFIFDEIRKKSEEYDILKIICLYSIINSGYKNKIYDQLRKEFFLVYGFQELFLWRNLEKLGILKAADNKSIYQTILKKLNLINEEQFESKEQKDISYIYNGFCPIILKLLEKMLEKGWGNIKDILKELSGEFEYPQDESEIISTKGDKQFILLIFIGGITYGELAGVRYLNSKLRNKKFIIITTNMINSKKLFDQMKKGKYTYTPVDPNDKSNIVLTFKEAFNQQQTK